MKTSVRNIHIGGKEVKSEKSFAHHHSVRGLGTMEHAIYTYNNRIHVWSLYIIYIIANRVSVSRVKWSPHKHNDQSSNGFCMIVWTNKLLSQL